MKAKEVTRLQLEFIDGPFDGHTQTVPHDYKLQPMVAIPVSRQVFNVMHKLPDDGGSRITSVAYYELERRGEGVVYRFRGAKGACQ